MAPKSLAQLRGEWRRQAFQNFIKHIPGMLIAAFLGAAMARAMFSAASVTVLPDSPLLTYLLTAPYWVYVLLLIPAGAVLTLPLVLACLGPYPSRAGFELNEQIRQARAASRAAGAEEG